MAENTNDKGNNSNPDAEFEERMRLKMELAQTINHYDINTEVIHHELGERKTWKKYDRELIDLIEEGIHEAHKAKKVMTYCNDGSEIAQFKINSHVRMLLSDRKEAKDNDRFPIEYYYIGGHYNNMEYIVCMIEQCVVEKEAWKFDLLFAVQYSLTPIQDCNEFLTYQLTKSFNNNIEEFVDFMDNICLEYKSFLADKYEPFYRRFIEKINAVKDKTNKQNEAIQNTKLTWNGTAGQLVYLFEQLRGANFFPISMDLQAEIKKHFVDGTGKTFTLLKQSKQNYLNSKTAKPKQADMLESIVNKAKKKE